MRHKHYSEVYGETYVKMNELWLCSMTRYIYIKKN